MVTSKAKPRQVEDTADSFLLFYLIHASGSPSAWVDRMKKVPTVYRKASSVITQLLYCAVFCVLHVVALLTHICTHILGIWNLCSSAAEPSARFCLILGFEIAFIEP